MSREAPERSAAADSPEPDPEGAPTKEAQVGRAYVALLRAVNLGSHGKVAMAGLRSWCDDLGFGDVATFIQSGNAVFTAAGTSEDEVARVLGDRIEAECGVRTPVIVRTHDELVAAVAANPLYDPVLDPKMLHLAFLDHTPPAERVAALDPHRSPGDVFAVDGRHVYLHYPNGSGRSKLTNDYLERTLGTISTARNWNTVVKLLELTTERQP